MKPEFEEIVEKYIKLVYFFARKWARDEDIDDMVQNTFLKAARSYDNFHFHSEGQLKSWLLTICRNIIIDRSRGPKLIQLSDQDNDTIKDSAIDSLDLVIKVEEEKNVLNTLSQLNPGDQEIVKLRIYEEMSFGEIAHVFQISESAVKMRFYRVIQKLKEK